MSTKELLKSFGGLSIGLRSTPRRCIRHSNDRCLLTKPRRQHLSSTSVRLVDDDPTAAIEPIKAAAEIDVAEFQPPAMQRLDEHSMVRLRVIPASPGYFSAKPTFTDDYVEAGRLLSKHLTLPLTLPENAKPAQWMVLDVYKRRTGGEPVKPLRYSRLLGMLRRLNQIHPSMMPEDVLPLLRRFKLDINPYSGRAKPRLVDEHGRARAVGRRKESSAVVYLVEGEGEVLINGKTLNNAFPRMHDRESAVWPLKATNRIDKYNVFAVVKGGGTTGQAEAITLGIARALMTHEPDLKTYLRKAGVVNRDPRMVERKKPGKRKARKMPAWVKR